MAAGSLCVPVPFHTHQPVCTPDSVDRRMLMRRQMVSWRVSSEVWTMEETNESPWTESLRKHDVPEVLFYWVWVRWARKPISGTDSLVPPVSECKVSAHEVGYCPKRGESLVPLCQKEPWSPCTRTNFGPTAPRRTFIPKHLDQFRTHCTRSHWTCVGSNSGSSNFIPPHIITIILVELVLIVWSEVSTPVVCWGSGLGLWQDLSWSSQPNGAHSHPADGWTILTHLLFVLCRTEHLKRMKDHSCYLTQQINTGGLTGGRRVWLKYCSTGLSSTEQYSIWVLVNKPVSTATLV